MNSSGWVAVVIGSLAIFVATMSNVASQLKRIADALEKKETRTP